MNVDLYDPANPEYQRFQNMRDNIFKTFGTRNLFAMLLPSMRDLPFFGHEWTLEVLELDAEQAELEKIAYTGDDKGPIDLDEEYDGI